jgi:hypothetical protein
MSSTSWRCPHGSRRRRLWAYKLLLVASLHGEECGRCADRCSRQPWWRLTSAHGGVTSPCRTAISSGTGPLSPSASMVCVLRATNFNSTAAAAAVRKALPSSSTRAHYLAPPDSATDRHEGASAGYCCDLFQVLVHVLPFRLDGVHGIQVAAHVQVQCVEGVCLILWGQKNQIRNNKISRDVKGLSSKCLVLGQVDVVFEHPSCCSSRTSCLSRRGVVSGPKEAHGGAAVAASMGPSRGIR